MVGDSGQLNHRDKERDDRSGDQWVHDQLVTMKAEIDSLQISTAEATRPWYRQASVLIAFLALAFSFGTTFYSLRRSHDQDVHNAKVELRDLIQRLTSLPVRNVDLDQKYPKDTAARTQAAALLNTENIVLAKQAVDIINEIPDEVSSVEYFAVASSLAFSGDYGQTTEFYERALDSANDATDFATAARSLGLTAFSRGDVRKGRAALEQALDVFQRFPTASSYYRANTNITTEIAWSGAELSAGNCSEALEHSKRAKRLLSPLGDDLLLGRRLSAQIEALRGRVDLACPRVAFGNVRGRRTLTVGRLLETSEPTGCRCRGDCWQVRPWIIKQRAEYATGGVADSSGLSQASPEESTFVSVRKTAEPG